ncbi:hypothetical protein DFH06DRAFT_1135991 [Mycena polygramma]|nr:hypothetical protein DFH06DRAFT_1135991 [Mycena polygramma]
MSGGVGFRLMSKSGRNGGIEARGGGDGGGGQERHVESHVTVTDHKFEPWTKSSVNLPTDDCTLQNWLECATVTLVSLPKIIQLCKVGQVGKSPFHRLVFGLLFRHLRNWAGDENNGQKRQPSLPLDDVGHVRTCVRENMVYGKHQHVNFEVPQRHLGKEGIDGAFLIHGASTAGEDYLFDPGGAIGKFFKVTAGFEAKSQQTQSSNSAAGMYLKSASRDSGPWACGQSLDAGTALQNDATSQLCKVKGTGLNSGKRWIRASSNWHAAAVSDSTNKQSDLIRTTLRNKIEVVEPASRNNHCTKFALQGTRVVEIYIFSGKLEEEEVRSCRLGYAAMNCEEVRRTTYPFGTLDGWSSTLGSEKRGVGNIAMVEIFGPLRGPSATPAQAAFTEKQGRRDPIRPPRTTTEGVNEPVVQGREQMA